MLSREQVESVYRQVLGRMPRGEEVAGHLSAVESLDDMLRVALESEEYAERLRQRDGDKSRAPTVVNVFHPDLADWGLPPGTRSEDGDAIVGREGWLFLAGGTNANLEQYVGAVEMGPHWPEEWLDVLRRRATEAAELGVASTLLVVPDKLAVYEEQYPEELPRKGPRPIELLLEVPDLPIAYPLERLRASAAAGDEVYLRTDTHLTFPGNELLFSAVLADLQVEAAPDFSDLPLL